MFGLSKKSSKSKTSEKKQEVDIRPESIQTIPNAFYGGKDPNIYESSAKTPKKTQSTSSAKKAPAEQPKVEQPPMPRRVSAPVVGMDAPQEKKAPAPQTVESTIHPPKSKKKWIILGSIGFLVIVAGVAAYSVYDLRQQKQAALLADQQAQQQQNQEPELPEQPEPLPEVPDEVPDRVATSTPDQAQDDTSLDPLVVTFENQFLATAPDIDNDDLTDKEEEVFGTDSGGWDTDEDGYYDGLEVANLYNPSGFAPRRIIESGLVREYVHPRLQYRVYYPSNWAIDSIEAGVNQVLMSAITGDYVRIQAHEKEDGQSFAEWFAAHVSGERFSEYRLQDNRFDVPGYVRHDGIVAFFSTSDMVYVLNYEAGSDEQLLYPNIMNMIFQSFRPSGVEDQLPEQRQIPTVNSTSTTSTPEMQDSAANETDDENTQTTTSTTTSTTVTEDSST